ncbi:DUF1653 domain-containing protein [Clostridium beijerinckii]|uniref:DUF1653 domain-containing protein n=1 Tax=Clostridium beijerinckii TaxID=1520 RepID=UPI00047D8EF4|nr:DUF1653 domain-containing protein [Clostridium beijerinckii]
MERKIIYPAIYKHFKNEFEPEKYIYATMGISKPMSIKEMREIYQEDPKKLQGTLYCWHTEEKVKFMYLKINGEWYHEKENFYEILVLYKSLYDDSGVYARPLIMFDGKVDKEKYPEIKQEFRFELVRY